MLSGLAVARLGGTPAAVAAGPASPCGPCVLHRPDRGSLPEIGRAGRGGPPEGWLRPHPDAATIDRSDRMMSDQGVRDMELQQFIEETLVQIAQGIVAANKALESTGAIVSPERLIRSFADKAAGRSPTTKPGDPPVHRVEFDVAVIVSSSSATSGGAGVKLAVVDLGTKGESGHKNTSESRIKFSIPMIYPTKTRTVR